MRLLLYLCFLLSGAAGLMYEVLWSKYLNLYVGSSAAAQIIVLSTFMAGLAIGGRWLGALGDRVSRPLAFYAALELVIGLYAFCFPLVFEAGRRVFLAVGGVAGPGTATLFAAKALAAVLTMLVPAIAMGGTLPVLARALIPDANRAGPLLARLYFLNSLGAVAGCLLSGFLMIPELGLPGSMSAAGTLSLAVAALAFLALRCKIPVSRVKGSGPAVGSESDRLFEAEPWRRILLGAIAISGAVSMIYEVAWIRLLALVLGGSTYAFSLMLATFILGLAIGGFWLSTLRPSGGYARIFGWSAAGVGLAVLVSLPFYARLPFWFNQLGGSLVREPGTFTAYELAQWLLCALVMIVPATLQGVTLPAATKAFIQESAGIGKKIGSLFALNTLGTIVGAAGAGFLLLPVLGVKGSLELAVALNLICGFAVLWRSEGGGFRSRAAQGMLIACVAALCFYLVGMKGWDREAFSAGAYRLADRFESYGAFREWAAGRKMVYYRDGVGATISVQDSASGQRMLAINGKVDATDRGDLPTQKGLGHVPMLLHPNPKKVLVIGLGSGATVGSLLAYDVERVDVVEISPEVIQASRLFEKVNGKFWEDRRVHVYCEDAKTFLQIVGIQYDVIVSEPTNPWIAGVAGVFSQEYYETCRRHLAPGGFFSQWMQTYDLDNRTYFLMLETYRRSFPFYTIWNTVSSDTLVVGSASPFRPDFDRMEAKLAQPRVAADFESYGVDSLLPVLGMQMLDGSQGPAGRVWSDRAHSDFDPVLEYWAPRGFFLQSRAPGSAWLDSRQEGPGAARLWIHDYLIRKPPSREALRTMVAYVSRFASLFGRNKLAWTQEWALRFPNDGEAALAYAKEKGPPRGPAAAAQDYERRRLQLGWDMEEYFGLRSALRAPGSERLKQELSELLATEKGKSDPNVWSWSGTVLLDLGDYAAAVQRFNVAAIGFQQIGQPEASLTNGIYLCKALRLLGDKNAALAAYHDRLSAYESDERVRIAKAAIDAMAP
ncbi:MAG: fused MFS/spermidine synthase [Verrucomicrobiae bacterium]|nr:fused MFS/spermidine synthase [Verrucomicrobiae bacterium]